MRYQVLPILYIRVDCLLQILYIMIQKCCFVNGMNIAGFYPIITLTIITTEKIFILSIMNFYQIQERYENDSQK